MSESEMKKFRARHQLSVVRDGAIKRIDPGQEVELTEEEAAVCLLHGSVEVEPDMDRMPTLAEFREKVLSEVEAEIPRQYARLQAQWNEKHGVLLRKEREPGRDDAPPPTPKRGRPEAPPADSPAPSASPASSSDSSTAETRPARGGK